MVPDAAEPAALPVEEPFEPQPTSVPARSRPALAMKFLLLMFAMVINPFKSLVKAVGRAVYSCRPTAARITLKILRAMFNIIRIRAQ